VSLPFFPLLKNHVSEFNGPSPRYRDGFCVLRYQYKSMQRIGTTINMSSKEPEPPSGEIPKMRSMKSMIILLVAFRFADPTSA
jgi:hypothetical protein